MTKFTTEYCPFTQGEKGKCKLHDGRISQCAELLAKGNIKNLYSGPEYFCLRTNLKNTSRPFSLPEQCPYWIMYQDNQIDIDPDLESQLPDIDLD